MFCPFCGTDNAADKKYCRSCGAVLPAASKPNAKLRSAQINQNNPTSASASQFVPPQPPDLPNTLKTPKPDAAEASPRIAPRNPDDLYNTRPSYAVPLPIPGAPSAINAADFLNETQKNEPEDLFQTKVEFRKIARPSAGAIESDEQIPDLAETVIQTPPDVQTIQMSSLPSTPPIDSNATKLISPTPRRPPQPPPIPGYHDSLPTLVSPKAMQFDDQFLVLDDLIGSASKDVDNAQSVEDGIKKVETLEAGSPVELRQFNQTMETPAIPDTGVFDNTLMMETLPSDSDDNNLSTEAFAYPTEPSSYSTGGPPSSRSETPQVETLVFDQPKLEADKTLPADTNQLLPSAAKQQEDLFKTRIVPQTLPQTQQPQVQQPQVQQPQVQQPQVQQHFDPFKTVPMQAVQKPLPQSLKPEFEKTFEPPMSKTEPLKPTLPAPIPSPMAKPPSDQPPVTAYSYESYSPPPSPVSDYSAPYYKETRVETEHAVSSESEVFEKERPRRFPVKLIAAVAALLLIASAVAAIFIYRSFKGTGAAQNLPQPVAAPTAAPEPPPPPANMVMVPAGEYSIGVAAGDEYSTPQHTVYLNAFYIDVYEVTKEEYAKFIAETNRPAPGTWKDGNFPGAPNEPVTDVNWDDAAAYAAWVKKRLPTEEEWEAAASGKDHLRYPWGDNWDKTRANTIEYGAKSLMPVGKITDGKGPFGTFDMCGNVWEWTSSQALPYPEGVQLLKSPEQPDQYRIFRGGSFKDKSTVSSTVYRNWDTLARTHSALGFRCAKDAPK